MYHECLLSVRVFDECVSVCSVCESVVDTRLHGVHVHGAYVHGCVHDVYVHVCMCMSAWHVCMVCMRRDAYMDTQGCVHVNVNVYVHGIMCA